MRDSFCRLDGRRILLVGTGGIGTETAKELAAAGAKLLLVDHPVHGLKRGPSLQKELAEGGADVSYFPSDIESDSDVSRLLAEIEAAQLLPDSFVFTAGVVGLHGLNATVAQLAEQMNLHYYALHRFMQPLVPKWLEAGSGTAVVVTSVAATHPAIAKIGYSASKAAATNYIQSLAALYGPKGLRFVPMLLNRVGTESALERAAISPAFEAEMVSTLLSGDWMKTAEVAGAIRYLLSPIARSFNGSPFMLDDGANLALSPCPKAPV